MYLYQEPTGKGHKLKNLYKGVFIVQEIVSPHLVILRDPTTNKLSKPVHVDRLKCAYVRAPTPSNYFHITSNMRVDSSTQTEDVQEHTVETDAHSVHHSPAEDTSADVSRSDQDTFDSPQDSDNDNYHHSVQELSEPNVASDNRTRRKSKRCVGKPLRYRTSSNDDPESTSDLSSTSSGEQYKIKRILAQRKTDSGIEYLIHFVGEPSQNAQWLPASFLNDIARKVVTTRPPPFV